MITARVQKSLKTALAYFREHLANGKSIVTSPGIFIGKGAARLGLSGEATEVSFNRLCHGRHPATNELLSERDRTVNRRIFYDTVPSPPKSVTVVSELGGDSRVDELERQVVLKTFSRLESFASVRVRKDGADSDRTTGELVAALFRHKTSRLGDPQIHSHLVIFNTTWDEKEQKWKALQAGEIYRALPYLTEVYRSFLAKGLVDLGYSLRETRNGFEIAGVPQELLKCFSKRKAQIDEAARSTAAKQNKPITSLSRFILARRTRPAKSKDLSANEIRQAQKAQVSNSEWLALREVVSNAVTGRNPRPVAVTPTHALDHARDHLFERASSVRREDLLREALRFSRGSLVEDDLLEPLRARSEFVWVEGHVTTREMIGLERQLITLVNSERERHRPLGKVVDLPKDLTLGQKTAVESLLRSTDGVMSLIGRAGTGKTHVLKTFVGSLESGGKEVVLTAPTTAAVEVLRKDGFSEAQTVQRLLIGEDNWHTLSGKLLIVDEANLLSVRQLHKLLHISKANQCRVLLVGDTQQHHSVEAGDALRLLETQSRLRSASLYEIQRQKPAAYREAVQKISEGRILEGFEKLASLGAIIEEPSEERRIGQMASEYVASVKAGRSALMVAPTWREIGAVTSAVRREMKEKKLLGKGDQTLFVHDGLDWTEAQRRDLRQYRPGLILRFHQRTRDFSPGEWGSVSKVAANHLSVKRFDGSEVKVTGKQAKAFDVAETKPIAIAPGERLLIQANCRRKNLINGQLVTVKTVLKNGSLILTDGRRIGSGFRSFTYGYAITSHAAEGKTVDHVYVSASQRSHVAVNREQFYVSVSRGRRKVRVFTDNKAELLSAIKETSARTGAIELISSPKRIQTQKRYVAPKFAVA